MRIALAGLVLTVLAARGAALEPAQVLVVVNAKEPASLEVGAHYVLRRGIPEENVVRISTLPERQIARDVYEREVRDPIRAHLDGKGLRDRIGCIVTTYGVPYVVAGGGGAGKAALDSELAVLDLPADRLGERWLLNPYYAEASPDSDAFDRRFGTYLTSRLDGPDPETALALVDRAIEAEEKGVEGKGYFDARGLTGRVGYATGDYSVRSAYRDVTGAGYETLLDDKAPVFAEGACPDAAWYWGWYSRGTFVDAFEGRLARGAVCCHIASSEAVSLRDGTGWCLGFLRAGAVAVMGPVDEPYLAAFPRGEHFFRVLLSGAPLGEAYWRSQPLLSWMMVLVGDPLYRPLLRHPRPFLRAEEIRVEDPAPGGNGDGVPSPGETVLVRVHVRLADNGAPAYPGGRARLSSDSPAAGVFPDGPVEVPAMRPGASVRVGSFRVRIGRETRSFAEVPLRLRIEGEVPRDVPFVLTAGAVRLTWTAGAETLPRRSPDGRWLAYRHGADLVVHDVAGGEADRRYGPPPGLLGRFPQAWSPDSGRLLVRLFLRGDRGVRGAGAALLSPEDGEWLPVPGGDGLEEVAWDPEGALLLASERDVARWRPGPAAVETIHRGPAGARLARFSADGSRFAYVEGGDVVFGGGEGSGVVRAMIGDGLSGLRLDATGRTALVVRGEEALAVSADAPEKPLSLGTGVVGAAFASRGRVALVLDGSGRARLAIPSWDRIVDLGPAAAGDGEPQGGGFLLARMRRDPAQGLEPDSVHRLTLEGEDRGVLVPAAEFGAVTDLEPSLDGRLVLVSAQRETAVDIWAVPLPR